MIVGRIHKIIEHDVDIFISICNTYLDECGLNEVCASKDIETSIITVGRKDQDHQKPGFGFTIPYESVINNLQNAFDEFKFKVKHFANNIEKFSAFRVKNDKNRKP